MFTRFVYALLSFCVREFPAKSETRKPRKIILERSSYSTYKDNSLTQDRILWLTISLWPRLTIVQLNVFKIISCDSIRHFSIIF